MSQSLAVVKVGGSLYDWPDFGQRLRDWLWSPQAPWKDVLLVPGGGPTADVIRDFDRVHKLGEAKAHWLALAALRLNAFFLAELLPSVGIIGTWEALPPEGPHQSGTSGSLPRASILDPRSFACGDRQAHPDTGPPPCWSVTSDSVAARAAVVYDADYLILLKSVTIPDGMAWEEAGERGYVDAWFARTIHPALPRLQVRAVNLRDWTP